MTALPYMPLYVSDFEGSTTFLTLEEEGLYFRLLRLMWQTPGATVPNDLIWLSRRLRITHDQMPTLETIISDFCHVSDGRLVQKRLLEEYEKTSKKILARKIAGKAGGKSKALKTKEKHPSKALAKDKQTSSIQNQNQNQNKPSIEGTAIAVLKTTGITNGKKNVKGTRLPEGWTPSETLARAIADRQKFTAEQISDELYKFTNYWCGVSGAKGIKLDWDATFRNWCANSYSNNGSGVPGTARRGGGSQGAVQQAEGFEKVAVKCQELGESDSDFFA